MGINSETVIRPFPLLIRTNLLFDGHVFLYLSVSLQQPLPAAHSLRQIGEVNFALMKLTTRLKTFTIGPAEANFAFTSIVLEPLFDSFNHQ
jgi:hypothetical protein